MLYILCLLDIRFTICKILVDYILKAIVYILYSKEYVLFYTNTIFGQARDDEGQLLPHKG